MSSSFASRGPGRAGRPSPGVARRRTGLQIDRLEERRLLAILPGQIVPSATYTDADGDTVSITVTGPLGSGAGFSVELAGLALDNADATRINLSGLRAANGLRIVVTP